MHRFNSHAPLIRSSLVCVQYTLAAFQDWNDRPSLKELVSDLIDFSVDPRPKIRKLSHEILQSCLWNYEVVQMIAPHVKNVMVGATRRKPAGALYLTPLLKSVILKFDQNTVDQIIGPLLQCASLGNTYLTASIFSVIVDLCISINKIRMQLNQSQLRKLHEGLVRLKPNLSLPLLFGPWLSAYAAVVFHNSFNISDAQDSCLVNIFEALNSSSEELYQACQFVMAQIPSKMISEKFFDFLEKLVNSKEFPLASCNYFMAIIRDIVSRHNFELPSNFLQSIAALYDRKELSNCRLDISRTIGEFIKRFGPDKVLNVIPLNLEPSSSKQNIARAWLLTTLKESVYNTDLSLFVNYLLPIAERLKSKIEEFKSLCKLGDAKVYETLFYQIWCLLPSFLRYPVDFQKAFPLLAPQIGVLINENLCLRPILINGLSQFIQKSRNFESDVESSSIELYRMLSIDQVQSDLDHFASYLHQFLPLLFNIFGATDSNQRDYLLVCIENMLNIASSDIVKNYFSKICERIFEIKETEEQASLIELACIMAIATNDGFLNFLKISAHFALESSHLVLQKRSYKALTVVFSQELHSQQFFFENIEILQKVVLADHENISVASKKGRFRFLLQLSPIIPDEYLWWIPALLPEVILGTKEINQKSRLYAFELILALARRMHRGGSCAKELSFGYLQANMEASLNEFLLMLVAGLAGKTPHMISATILALARLIFEFRGALDSELIRILLGDIINLLSSPSREVVKAAFGFIKVTLVSLESALIQPYLSHLVVSLLNWSNEHGLHFKVRVRHLIERLIRKYGFDVISRLVPFEHQKLVINIKKRKERLRRRKAASLINNNTENEEDDGSFDSLTEAALSRTSMFGCVNQTKSNTTKPSAQFERAMNESESELEDDDFECFDLNSFKNIPDEDIESVLSKKLSLIKTKCSVQCKDSKPTLKKKDDPFKTLPNGKILIEDSLYDGIEDDIDDNDSVISKDQGSRKFASQKRYCTNDSEVVQPFQYRESVSGNQTHMNSSSYSQLKKNSGVDICLKRKKYEPYAYVPLQRATSRKHESCKTEKISYFMKKEKRGRIK